MNNFKVKATKNIGGAITKGKIYEFIDGRVQWDDKEWSFKYESFEDFLSQNINFKGYLKLYKDNSTFKVICVKGDNNFVTKGKVYEFIDGITTWDNGMYSSCYEDYIDLIKGNLSFQSLLEPYNEDKYTMDIHEVLNLGIGTVLDSNDGRTWKVFKKLNNKMTLINMNDYENIILDSETLELKFKIKESPYKIESFLEAIKAYEDGSVIGCKTNHNFDIYEPKKNPLNLNCEQILDGEWLVYKR